MHLKRVASRSKLTESLSILIREKTISEIKITDLVREAGVSKPTFYSNYSVVEDIVEEHLNDLFGEWLSSICSSLENKLNLAIYNYTYTVIYELLCVVSNDDEIFNQSIRGRAGYVAILKVRKFLASVSELILKSGKFDIDVEFVDNYGSNFYSGVLTEVILSSIEGRNLSCCNEELSRAASALLVFGISRNPIQ